MRLVLLVLFAALTLGACAGERPPLHSPYEATNRYGYRDERLGPDRIRVTYIGPVRNLPAYRGDREAAVEAAVRESSDLALLRAAELASQAGAQHLAVERRDSKVDVREYEDIYYPGYYPYPYPYHPYHYYPYGYPHPYFPPHVYRYALGRVTVVIDVTFREEPGKETFATDETLSRLRSRYGVSERGGRASGGS